MRTRQIRILLAGNEADRHGNTTTDRADGTTDAKAEGARNACAYSAGDPRRCAPEFAVIARRGTVCVALVTGSCTEPRSSRLSRRTLASRREGRPAGLAIDARAGEEIPHGGLEVGSQRLGRRRRSAIGKAQRWGGSTEGKGRKATAIKGAAHEPSILAGPDQRPLGLEYRAQMHLALIWRSGAG
jgi:hypothetical protein